MSPLEIYNLTDDPLREKGPRERTSDDGYGNGSYHR
jgi:hypothetical protein